MTRIIDISTPLTPGMVAWPGSPGVTFDQLLALEAGDVANASLLSCDVHCGTHVDAPLHVLSDGHPMSAMLLDDLVGQAEVVDVGDVREITAALLSTLVPTGARRVLLKTANSRAPGGAREFDEDFAAITVDAASWLVEQGVRLIGIDYLSIQRFADDQTTHEVLLGAGLVVLEGLTLRHVTPGPYELLCLPVSIPELEAAPARAVLRLLEES